MREIRLTQGMVVRVDEDDYVDLNQHKWFAHKGRYTFYAERNAPMPGGGQVRERMHRVILARKLGRVIAKGEETDHINGDGLDNRRDNLRLATNSQNKRNCRRRASNPSSQYLGVSKDKRRKRWRAHIQVNGKQTNLGHHATELDAAMAREAYIAAHPELMARTNFPRGAGHIA